MRDQIDNPLDRAAYWIEYVIRHRGAPHLKPKSYCKKSLFQRELLDVNLVQSILLLIAIYICFRFTFRFASKICNKFHHMRNDDDKIKVE